MYKNARHALFLRLFAALAFMLIATAPLQAAQPVDSSRWIATWTASPQPLWEGDFALPINLPSSLWNQTVRQVARVSVGGRHVRVVLSNEYGSRPLVIGAAHIALASAGATITAGSDRTLTFGGQSSVTIPPGAPAISDPVDLDLGALGSVAVSVYLPEPTAPSTFHWDGRQTGYVIAGNQVAAAAIKADATLTTRVFLNAVLVDTAVNTRTVVAFGDSITDGAGSTPDRNARWPDFLAQRLVGDHIAVLNAGISGARVLRNKMGVNALARFDHDVLDQPGVSTVIVLMGINDIGWRDSALGPQEPAPTADELIAGYRQLIARAHVRGVRIVGATLTPFEAALQDTPMKGYYNLDKERVRQAVNRWIRESHEFDAVVDFDAVVRDPAHPQRFLAAYDSGDHLHPGDAGYQVMAAAVDTQVLFGSH
ncbi:SGNH/GDSL hydrolase family protein [Dyella tabacisoli]|uniref:SGNH/GDSL hydrolase family protein n=1 Tax=Dyella tabacisoli TaxID=2282381 RepID=A0A369UIK4_9GAMM|nr:SGNH/GDSL hydrolase family protein [Dyella tabacisoli]RDD80337.1 SGNH/GDSL hydrolase family protein [Dyella tabacisoli]